MATSCFIIQRRLSTDAVIIILLNNIAHCCCRRCCDDDEDGDKCSSVCITPAINACRHPVKPKCLEARSLNANRCQCRGLINAMAPYSISRGQQGTTKC